VDENGELIKKNIGIATLRATAKGTDLYEELTVAVSDRDASATVVKMQMDGSRFVALLSDGTLWQWGSGLPIPEKIELENDNVFIRDFAVASYIVVVDDSDTLNLYKYKDGTLDNTPIYGVPMSGVAKVEANSDTSGTTFMILKKDGTVWGWGSNSYGQLGIGNTTYQSQAVQIGLTDVADIVVGGTNGIHVSNVGSFFLLEDGTLWRSGANICTTPQKIRENVDRIRAGYHSYGRCQVFYKDKTAPELISSDGSSIDEVGDWMDLAYCSTLYIEDGLAYVKGTLNSTTNYGQYGIGDETLSKTEYKQVHRIRNVQYAWQFGSQTFYQTSDGKFYAAGLNSSNQLGVMTSGNVYVPERVFFGLQFEDAAPALEDTNLTEENVLEEPALVLDFDRAMMEEEKFSGIILQDSTGQLVSASREIRLDKLIITPVNALTKGETYTLTIPRYAIASLFGTISQGETITFTAGDITMPEQEKQEEDVEQEDPVIHETQIDPEALGRDILTEDKVLDLCERWKTEGSNYSFYNNAIVNRLSDDDVTKWLRIRGADLGSSESYKKYQIPNNYWGTTNALLIEKQIVDFEDFNTLVDLDLENILTQAPETVWPFAVRAGLIDKNGEEVDVIGNETVTFFVEFNRDMDESIPLRVRFGSYFPYADYEVEGEYVSSRRWEGTTTLTTIIENGYQFWSIENGRAEDEPYKELFRDWGRFTFEIDTSHALAMNLQGNPTDEGVELSWNQDDFDTLAGYNLYRADEDEDAYYQKLNGSIIPVGSEEFFDDTVEPGKVYYYKFTVVKTDLSESEPSGKIMIMSKDTMSPIMYHTPVYQAYEGSNVVISATVTDNLTLQSVKLHYQVGDGTWQQVAMNNMNDKYSAVISGDKVTLEGLKYYITASDGVTQAQKGSESEPYVITVQADPGEMALGDVNGDGRITILDALMLLRAINNKVVLDAEQFACADLNADGKLTSAEALVILKYANGELGSVQMS